MVDIRWGKTISCNFAETEIKLEKTGKKAFAFLKKPAYNGDYNE